MFIFLQSTRRHQGGTVRNVLIVSKDN